MSFRDMLIVVGLVLACGTSIPVAAAEPLEGRIVTMLSGIESMPSEREWQALGVDSVPVLITIADDPAQATFRRARALVVLGYFDDARAASALATVVRDDAAHPSLRRHALLGLSRAAPEEALPHLERALESGDLATRQVAVRALADSSRPEAKALLTSHRARESRAFLVEQIDAALAATKEGGRATR